MSADLTTWEDVQRRVYFASCEVQRQHGDLNHYVVVFAAELYQWALKTMPNMIARDGGLQQDRLMGFPIRVDSTLKPNELKLVHEVRA